MPNLRLIIVTGAILILMHPLSALACNVRPYAKKYINQIQKVVGGDKPALVIFSGKNDDAVAYYNYDLQTIYIYKGDYKGSCVEETPFLKSVIAHEYTHHLQKNLKKIAKLNGEKLANVGEHVLADQILGGAEYDNDFQIKYPKQYQLLKNFILRKQTVAIVKTQTQTVAMKKK